MGKKFDVIVVGELNVDVIMNGISFLPQSGKEVFAKNMALTLGSSSAIFASNLSSLGMSVAFIGKLGKDLFGDFVLDSLQEKKVDTSFIVQQDALQTGATVAFSFGENRAMVTYQGAMEALSLNDISEASLKQARHMHFSNCFAQTALKEHIPELFSKARNCGLTTSFDTQFDPLEAWDLNLNEILPLVDVFLPNEEELLNMTRKANVEDAITAIRGVANLIVVKQGNKGSISVSKDDSLFMPAFINPEPVDTIGAGDSFNAGFIYKWIQQESIHCCQQFGNFIGALSTTAVGGTTAFNDIKNTMANAKEKFGYAARK